eukprot:6335231-Lingulodinium_polyedra.AAC.1
MPLPDVCGVHLSELLPPWMQEACALESPDLEGNGSGGDSDKDHLTGMLDTVYTLLLAMLSPGT